MEGLTLSCACFLYIALGHIFLLNNLWFNWTAEKANHAFINRYQELLLKGERKGRTTYPSMLHLNNLCNHIHMNESSCPNPHHFFFFLQLFQVVSTISRVSR